MHMNRPALYAAQWIIPDTVSVNALIDLALYEQAWWIALRCGKYAHKGVVWADGIRPRTPFEPMLPGAILVDIIIDQ